MELPEITAGPFEGIFTHVQRAADGTVRWRSTVSDDGVDLYGTRMTTDLHEDFIRNAQGAMPYLTISHYNQLARIGRADKLYRDGRRLKAEGSFFVDSEDPFVAQLAQAAAERALAEQSMMPRLRQIRTSIGFTPTGADVEDLGIIGYTRGRLPEITMTCSPGNSRVDFGAERSNDVTVKRSLSPDFMQQDAASIVGEELAAELAKRYGAATKGLKRAGEDEDGMVMLYRALQGGEGDVSDPEADETSITERTATITALQGRIAGGEDSDELRTELEGEIDKLAIALVGRHILTQRVGKKLQGAKLQQMGDAVDGMQSAHGAMADHMGAMRAIMDWAQSGPAGGDGGGTTSGSANARSIAIRERLTDKLGPLASLADALAVRQMGMCGDDTEPDASIMDLMDYHAMCDYVFTATFTLSDIVMENLEPDDPNDPAENLTLAQRQMNIQNVTTEYLSIINAVLMQQFGGGRSIEEEAAVDNKDEMEVQRGVTDVKAEGAGTEPVKPVVGSVDASPDLNTFDTVVTDLRDVLARGGTRGEIQDRLDALGPAIQQVLPAEEEEREGEIDDAVIQRIAGLEIGQATIAASLEQLADRIEQSMRAAPSEETERPSYAPPVPRRRSFPATPPAPSTAPATTVKGGQARTGLTPREIAERSMNRRRSLLYP